MTFDKKRRFLASITLLACVSVPWGCRSSSSPKISNEQINADIAKQVLNTAGSPSPWTFGQDTTRCFEIHDSKFADSKAVLTVRVASAQIEGGLDTRFENISSIKTVLGLISLNYKNEDGKWVLEKAENQGLLAKPISVDDWKNTFVKLQLPLCDNYEHKDS
jgi:hypothetical protein